MNRAAIYARISQGDEKTPAVKNQVKACEQLALDAGYTVVDVHSDDGISAYKQKVRPGFLDLIDGIRAKKYDVILAVAEDRFTRFSEEKWFLQSECVKAGVTWHTKAGGPVDPSTASGGLLATITGALAQYESAIKAERIRRSVDDRLAAGKDLGGPRPFGWEKDRLTIRESEAEVIRTAYKMILDGGTIYGVAKLWTDLGMTRDRGADLSKPWPTRTARHVLLNERNAGRLVVKGVTYADDRPRIIDPDTFDQVKAILKNPARAPKRGPVPRVHPGLQSIVCGVCGNALSVAAHSGHLSYRCGYQGRPGWSKDLKHPTIRVEILDKHLSSKLFYIVAYRAMTKQDTHSPNSEIPALRLQLADLARQRDLAQEMAFLPGANIALAKKKLEALGKAIEEVDNALAEALGRDVSNAAVEAAVEALKGVKTINDLPIGEEPPEWRTHWETLSPTDKRALTKALLPGARLLTTEQAQQGEKEPVKNRIGRGSKKGFHPPEV